MFKFSIIYHVSVVVSQGTAGKEVTSCRDKSGMKRWWDEQTKINADIAALSCAAAETESSG